MMASTGALKGLPSTFKNIMYIAEIKNIKCHYYPEFSSLLERPY
jgi:hypothetical protein